MQEGAEGMEQNKEKDSEMTLVLGGKKGATKSTMAIKGISSRQPVFS